MAPVYTEHGLVDEPAAPQALAPETMAWLPAGLQALRHRNYRLYFFGQLISLVGFWMQNMAQGWLVLRLTDSPLLLGMVTACSSLPVLLFSLPAGTLGDRLPRRRIMLVTNMLAMVFAVVLALLLYSGLIAVWHILLLAALHGMVRAFEAPARQAFIIEMVGRDDLLNAIALNSTVFNTARFIGPALAGLAVAAVGEAPVFFFNGLSYGAVIAGLLLMRLPPFEAPPQPAGNQLTAGLKYIQGQPVVRTLLLQAGALCLFCYVYLPMLPVFARDVFGVGADGLGWLAAANGSGALIAAISLAQFSDYLNYGRVLRLTLLVCPVALLGFALVPVFAFGLLALVIIGWTSVFAMSLTNTILQVIVPDHLRSRVMSVFVMLPLGLGAMGGMLAGTLAEWVGQVTLVVAGSALVGWLAIVLTMLRTPQVWRHIIDTSTRRRAEKLAAKRGER